MRTVKLIFLCLLTSIAAEARSTVSDIETGPWISNVSDNTATILWTTRTPGKAWVELEDGTVVWESFAGRRIFGRSHSVRIDGLKPGQIVRYRVGGEILKDDSNPRDPIFSDSFSGSWHQLKTFDPSASTCRFTMFNDIHMHVGIYEKMAARIDSSRTDFILLNGDITSAGNYNMDTLVRYNIRPLGHLANGLPIMFSRGNHEGRGNNTPLIKAAFPNDGPAFYYFFRVGPVAFIVLDQGETHAERAAEYSGSEVNEEYLREQMEWAKTIVGDPAFTEASAHVCFIHAGMFNDPDENDYHLQRWMNGNIVPFLNENGIDLMLSGDLHRHRIDEPGTCGNNFPILSNDAAKRLEFKYEDETVTVEIFDDDDHVTHRYVFRPEKRQSIASF